jgi:predicted DCC family thiol-disulfide oxidoreductase YuxK
MKPVLIYDGDCGFCRRWIERCRSLTGEAIEYVPFQDAAPRFPNITIEQFKQAVKLIEPDGRIFSGAEAVYRSLRGVRGCRWLTWAYAVVPGFAPASESVYRWIARHRGRFT